MKMVLYKTVRHFFPNLRRWIERMGDPRNKKKITYSLPAMTWIGILMFLLKLGSRRQINFEFDSEAMVRNINVLTGTTDDKIDKIPVDGTLEYLLKKINPERVSGLRTKMMKHLIRNKCFTRFRLFGHYMIVVDGTGHLTFNRRHCEHCLRQKKGGKVVYWYHPVLEAKLVLPNGMAFSMETEFVENPDENVSRQDCELKAFYRLAERLKTRFPQLKICMLLDSLYAKKPVIDVCEKNGWKYIIVFKEGSMPEVYQEYESLKRLSKGNRGEYRNEQIRHEYRWAEDVLQYKKNASQTNVLECVEFKFKENEETRYVWLTNFSINEFNYREIAGGGRLRWKIENEGFNMQKNGGYNLEHAYSWDNNARKSYYLFLQIAHMLSQLIEKGSLLVEDVKKHFGSIRNIARRLLESLRTSTFNQEEIQAAMISKFQIRLRAP